MKFAQLFAAIFFACSPATEAPPADGGTSTTKLKVFAAFATEISEPWDGVIHEALLDADTRGQIDYTYKDHIGYSGTMEQVLREAATTAQPGIIFGDAFGNEEAARKVAAEFPNIKFVFGSEFGPAEPNFSVFDNWIHEPAFLCGLIAGKTTTTGNVGVVGGMAVAEVNRVVNAFIAGVKESKPTAKVFVTFINSWFSPSLAEAAAEAQVVRGADVLFAERFGVIEVAKRHNLRAFGNMSDQNSLAPDHVITGPVWNMRPTVQYVISQVKAGTYSAQDLKDFSMMAKGGASLAPYHKFANTLPPDVVSLVNDRSAKIISGLYRVPILEEPPLSD